MDGQRNLKGFDTGVRDGAGQIPNLGRVQRLKIYEIRATLNQPGLR